MSDDPIAESHSSRMQRKKAIIDAKIESAGIERGVLVVTTGNGKGKSSSGFGMVARALGHGMKVGIIQFIKGAQVTGEEQFFRRFPDEVIYRVMGEGFTWDTQDKQRDIAKAQTAWEEARKLLKDDGIGLVLLDELNIALKLHYLDLATVLADIAARPVAQHVVVTGRGAPAELVAVADTVTDMTLIKHAFAAGVKAQLGIEW